MAHVLSIMLTVCVRALVDLAALSLCWLQVWFGHICLMLEAVDVYCLLFVGVVLSHLVLGIRIAERPDLHARFPCGFLVIILDLEANEA